MTSKKRILLIEDEEDIAALIKLQAELSGYDLRVETDGLKGFKTIEHEKPDLVILDVMLPGENGLDVCRKIKSHPDLKSIPVIILSAKGEEIDIVLGLELGADDYVPKPFSPKILFSRIKAVLRRGRESSRVIQTISFSDYTLDTEGYVLKKSNKVIPLTLTEFGIIRRLASSKGKVLTRNQLLLDITSDEESLVDRNIDVHVASLRKKLGPSFDWIETVRGVGYKFKEDSVL